MARRRWPTDTKVAVAILMAVVLVEAIVVGAHNGSSTVATAPATTSTSVAPHHGSDHP